jgi:hypothetical protein
MRLHARLWCNSWPAFEVAGHRLAPSRVAGFVFALMPLATLATLATVWPRCGVVPVVWTVHRSLNPVATLCDGCDTSRALVAEIADPVGIAEGDCADMAIGIR